MNNGGEFRVLFRKQPNANHTPNYTTFFCSEQRLAKPGLELVKRDLTRHGVRHQFKVWTYQAMEYESPWAAVPWRWSRELVVEALGQTKHWTFHRQRITTSENHHPHRSKPAR
jgi:hypothetical protein